MMPNQPEQRTIAAALRLVPVTSIDNAHNVLPAGATMKGEMTASADLSIRIDGHYSGSISLGDGSSVYISKDAVVDAESIDADLVLIEGRVKGNVTSRKAMELTATAVVQGTVTYLGKLDIHAGAKVRGQISGPQD